MGHNSFIKGSITQVSLGFRHYLWVQHLTAATFPLWEDGGEGSAAPVRERRTPAAEVSSVESYRVLSVTFIRRSLVTQGMIHRMNNFLVQGQGTERWWLIHCDVPMLLCAPKRNGKKSLCNYTQWHVSPNYNDVYHNWISLCSDSMKTIPRIPQPTWPYSSPSI